MPGRFDAARVTATARQSRQHMEWLDHTGSGVRDEGAPGSLNTAAVGAPVCETRGAERLEQVQALARADVPVPPLLDLRRTQPMGQLLHSKIRRHTYTCVDIQVAQNALSRSRRSPALMSQCRLSLTCAAPSQWAIIALRDKQTQLHMRRHSVVQIALSRSRRSPALLS